MDLVAYRSAVADLVGDVAEGERRAGDAGAEDALARGIGDERVRRVLDGLPGGLEAAGAVLRAEMRAYRPSSRSSASDLPSMVRIYLLSQIDAVWWCGAPTFQTDADVRASTELVDLEALRRRRLLRFRYRLQPAGLVGRSRDWAMRRLAPDRRPHTSGLRFTQARPESVVLLNELADEFAAAAPSGTPGLWVTSIVRSIQHQHRLRALGYAAVLPSSHCSGYAMDIEMRWFRRFDADRVLASLLLARQDGGQVNVIDEGQAWHVCVSPAASAELRRTYDVSVGR